MVNFGEEIDRLGRLWGAGGRNENWGDRRVNIFRKERIQKGQKETQSLFQVDTGTGVGKSKKRVSVVSGENTVQEELGLGGGQIGNETNRMRENHYNPGDVNRGGEWPWARVQ